MARITKAALRNFNINIMKARGLIRFQFYAEDFLETGGKESLGKLMAFLGDMMASLGLEDFLDFHGLIEGKIAPIVERELGPILEKRFASIDQERLERAAKELEAKLLPRLKEFRAIVDEILIVVERVMLEQALVAIVTAFEVYLRDVTVDAVAQNKFLRARFTQQLRERLRYEVVAEAGENLALASATVVADSYNFYLPESVTKHLKTLLGPKAPPWDLKDQETFAHILAFRNLIVHRGGIVDRDFKRRTGYKGKLGEPVLMKREFVEQALQFVASIASTTQNGLETLHAHS